MTPARASQVTTAMNRDAATLMGSGPIFRGIDGIDEVSEFLGALRLWFFSQAIEDDQKKVREFRGGLRGSAIDWFEGFAETNDINETTYEQITTSLKEYYGCGVSKFDLWSQFINLRQNGALTEYNTKFRNYVNRFPEKTRPDTDTQLLQYVQGLKSGARDYVCRNNPETILDAQRLANLWGLTDESSKKQGIERSNVEFKKSVTGSNKNTNRWKSWRPNGNYQNKRQESRKNAASPQVCSKCNKLGITVGNAQRKEIGRRLK